MNKIKNELVLAFIILLFSAIEAKGGRGGGRGGRSGSRGSSGSGSSWGSSRTNFFGSGSQNRYGGSKTFSGTHAEQHNNGGWFHGFFQPTPYHYIHRPTYISRTNNVPATDNERSYNNGIENTTDMPPAPITDTHSFAVGLAINKALSNDFFSTFNMAHDISKYLEAIKNPIAGSTTTPASTSTTTIETTTTTEAPVPVPTYDSSHYNFALDSISKDDSNFPLDDFLHIVKSLENSFKPENFLSSSERFNMNEMFDTNTASNTN